VPSRLEISCEVYDYLLQTSPLVGEELLGFTELLNILIEDTYERTGTTE
jgi:hypothetical protein